MMKGAPSKVPWSRIGIDQNDTAEHRQLALKVAQESMVLLKNDGILPLDKSKYKKIAVIGPNANAADMQNGNYAGKPSRTVTILDGIRAAAGKDVEVVYEQGSRRTRRRDGSDPAPPEMADKAIEAAKAADLILFVGGIDAGLEKEEGSARTDVFEGFSRGDRTRIELPQVQEDLIKSLHKTGKPVVLVNCSGSAMAVKWEAENLPAILQAWYPGEEGGTAVAQVLFGEVNPAGRLPVTFYAATSDLPPFEDYSMKNRTYRYFGGKPLYPFGHGLSYTKFDYADAKTDSASVAADGTIKLTFDLKNSGAKAGDEVAQVYARRGGGGSGVGDEQRKLWLCGFARIRLAKGESKPVTLEIPASRFRRHRHRRAESERRRPGQLRASDRRQFGRCSVEVHDRGNRLEVVTAVQLPGTYRSIGCATTRAGPSGGRHAVNRTIASPFSLTYTNGRSRRLNVSLVPSSYFTVLVNTGSLLTRV